ncbi:Fic family protein [Aldersonia sp. NBC_00410]|uniref:Fic family protein n=1 Tax=Aldersonia sp. NBC_00410 TaxID=2975954 RepID=UPI00225C1CA0|nr:Fic family protein [Aldersonia sp. NBC_00410]MCX5041847.1 Fic family protein [Aldersonia sp. NBC_00410]
MITPGPALDHALTQTLATERFEGWQPTPEHVADLTALLTGATPFGDYLAKYRARYVDPPGTRVRPPLFARRRPYYWPGTTVLRNNFALHTPPPLRDLEFVATAGRLAQFHARIAAGLLSTADLDLHALHQHVFADVYPWAGHLRITEIRRGESIFARVDDLDQRLADLDELSTHVYSVRPDTAQLGYWLSRLYADYNHTHPFREGNGRTGTLYLHVVAQLCGHRLRLDMITRTEWIAASQDSMPLRRIGRPNHRPFLALFARALA